MPPERPRAVERRDCPACGHGRTREASETLSVSLPRCGVTVTVTAPARRCDGCGSVTVDPALRRRAELSAARELADRGVHSGDSLRCMRKALGLRAADLARLLDVTPETISHWETGKARPTRAAFAAVAAMVAEAVDGRTATLDRLALLAEGRPHPRSLAVKLGAGSQRS